MARYHYTRAIGHPLCVPPSTCMPTHRKVLFDAIGWGPHKCHWCGRSVIWKTRRGVTEDSLLADHLDNDSRNNSPENLVPACTGCNSGRHAHMKIQSGETVALMRQGDRYSKHRAVERTCLTCKQVFTIAIAELNSKKSAGRYCSMKCVYDRHRTRSPTDPR